MPLYGLNQYLVFNVIRALDVGGSITIHAFGAYYGLAASLVLSSRQADYTSLNSKNSASYISNIFSMIGVLTLYDAPSAAMFIVASRLAAVARRAWCARPGARAPVAAAGTSTSLSIVIASFPPATIPTFPLLGTLFLWLYWPSFNGALASISTLKAHSAEAAAGVDLVLASQQYL